MAAPKPLKILAIEYGGKRYAPTKAELRRLATDPMVDAPNIIVTYEDPHAEGGTSRQRPFRFASSEVSFGPDGTARVY